MNIEEKPKKEVGASEQKNQMPIVQRVETQIEQSVKETNSERKKNITEVKKEIEKTLGEKLSPSLEQDRSGITAYHSSTFDFNNFDLNKIGKAKNGQTLGYGLYFSGSKNNFWSNVGENVYKVTLNKGESPDEYDYVELYDPLTEIQYNKIYDHLNAIGDKKLQNRLRKILQNYYDHKGKKGYHENAFSLYKRIEDAFGGILAKLKLKSGHKKDVIKFLLDAGIDGLHDKNTTNTYVVFDPKAVTIEEKQKQIFKPLKS